MRRPLELEWLANKASNAAIDAASEQAPEHAGRLMQARALSRCCWPRLQTPQQSLCYRSVQQSGLRIHTRTLRCLPASR